ncbi:MAG: hypothetical protein K2K21_17675 [Lachnospiraceae bacterium]|nr:hypothetical protein [Lachnospiraceae bacterium]
MIPQNSVTKISDKEAEEALQKYLVDVNQWEEDYILEPLDSILRKVDNIDVYRFEMRFKDNVEDVGGRLISNYAISVDGKTILWYNPADDEYVVQE